MEFSFQRAAEMKKIKVDHTARPPIIHLRLSARPPEIGAINVDKKIMEAYRKGKRNNEMYADRASWSYIRKFHFILVAPRPRRNKYFLDWSGLAGPMPVFS
jgi:hypothetical protein